MADQLFLTTLYIHHIDAGEFEKIPKVAFIKGYLRTYARAVGLDGNAIVSAFEAEQGQASVVEQINSVGANTIESPPTSQARSCKRASLALW